MPTDTKILRLTESVLADLDGQAAHLVARALGGDRPAAPDTNQVMYRARHRLNEDLETRRLFPVPAGRAVVPLPPRTPGAALAESRPSATRPARVLAMIRHNLGGRFR